MVSNSPENTEDADRLWRDRQLMYRLYVEEGLKMSEISNQLGCSMSTVSNWLHRHDIRTRSNKNLPPQYGTDNNGHEYWRHRHPTETGESTRSWVVVHKLAAVAWFGRGAIDGMEVHHQNRIPWDNREENLELLSPEEHAKRHHMEKIGLTHAERRSLLECGEQVLEEKQDKDLSNAVKKLKPSVHYWENREE